MALNILAATNLILSLGDKVSVQGVLALGGYFATYARSSIFMRDFFFSSLIFKKKRQILLTLLIILIVKSLRIEQDK